MASKMGSGLRLLTPEREAKICELLRSGMSYRATAALVRVSEETLFGWLRRGKAEKGTRLSEFSERVREARAQWEAICIRTLRNAVVGGFVDVPVRDKDGNVVPVQDPVTGEVLRDAAGRPQVHMRSEFREPDAALAKWFIQRNNPREFGQVEGNQLLPDPQAELDKAPTVLPLEGESAHRKISTSLLAQAVKILADQGVDIPGFIPDPNAKKAKKPGDDVEDAEVVSETKFIEGPNVEPKP